MLCVGQLNLQQKSVPLPSKLLPAAFLLVSQKATSQITSSSLLRHGIGISTLVQASDESLMAMSFCWLYCSIRFFSPEFLTSLINWAAAFMVHFAEILEVMFGFCLRHPHQSRFACMQQYAILYCIRNFIAGVIFFGSKECR